MKGSTFPMIGNSDGESHKEPIVESDTVEENATEFNPVYASISNIRDELQQFDGDGHNTTTPEQVVAPTDALPRTRMILGIEIPVEVETTTDNVSSPTDSKTDDPSSTDSKTDDPSSSESATDADTSAKSILMDEIVESRFSHITEENASDVATMRNSGWPWGNVKRSLVADDFTKEQIDEAKKVYDKIVEV